MNVTFFSFPSPGYGYYFTNRFLTAIATYFFPFEKITHYNIYTLLDDHYECLPVIYLLIALN